MIMSTETFLFNPHHGYCGNLLHLCNKKAIIYLKKCKREVKHTLHQVILINALNEFSLKPI
jgi:hypothetical protein